MHRSFAAELIELGSGRQKGGQSSSPLGRPRRLLRRPKQHLYDGLASWLARIAEFSEIVRAAWPDVDAARGKPVEVQAGFVDRLLERLR